MIGALGLEGLSRAESQFDASAAKISRMPLSAEDVQAGDTVDLSEAMVSMMVARDTFEANLQVVKSGDELDRALLDMIG